MKDQPVWKLMALGLLGSAAVACSAKERERGATMPEGGGGAAPKDGGAPTSIVGGAEAVVDPGADADAGETSDAGGAGPIPPDEEAVDCGLGMGHPAADPSTCIFTDTSPWVIYQADDDTPAVAELYAVKRDLIGRMAPIKLNSELEEGWQAHWGQMWSPDRSMLTFSVRTVAAPSRAAIEVVSFDETGPHWRQRLEGEYSSWAPSGKALAVESTHGVSLYEREPNGSLQKVLEATDANSEFYGFWSIRDEFVFARTVKATGQSGIQRFARVQGEWVPQPIVDNLALARFQLNPTGTLLLFQEPATGNNVDGALYAQDLISGGSPQLVTAAGDYTFSWSWDGHRFLLVENDETGRARALWGPDPRRMDAVPVHAGFVFNSARLTPSGEQLLFREPVDAPIEDVSIFDPSKNATAPYDAIGRTGVRDGGPSFAPDGDLGVLPIRDDKQSPVKLKLFSLSTRRSERFDSIPPEHRYLDLQFSKRGEFLVYRKGVDRTYEGAYVDLRYRVVEPPLPVKLPGEGSAYSLALDPSGLGLYYVLERASGARECFYLDLSQQVAAEPVRVSRAGRVDYCGPQ